MNEDPHVIHGMNEDDLKETMGELMESCPPNQGVEFSNQGTNLLIKKMFQADLAELAQREDLYHIIVMPLRPNAARFANVLEETHYTPYTDANDKFGYTVFNWTGLMFNILSLPLKEIHLAEAIAAKMGFQLSKSILLSPTQDPKTNFMGIPVETFPMTGEHVYHLTGAAK